MSHPSRARVDVAALYRREAAELRRRARRILGSDVDAQEVVHEVFARLLEDPAQLARARSITAWLSGATIHRALNRRRDERTRARILAAVRSSPEIPSGERAAIAADVLSRLPAAVQLAAVRCFVEERTYEETAQTLACSPRRVCMLLQQARATARAL